MGMNKKIAGRRARRYAIISDVHSNIHALEEVLKDLDREDAETILCAGDLVGYGAFPNEVVRRHLHVLS